MLKTNQNGGFDCPGCAWGESPDSGKVNFCENGAKAVNWEATNRLVDPEFLPITAFLLSQLKPITGWNTKAVSRTQCDTMPSPTTMCQSLGMRLLHLSRNISINWIHRTKRSFIPLVVQATKRRFCISYLSAHSVPTTSQIVPTCVTKPVQSG